jgi:type II secretory pathway component PulF
VSDQPRKRDWGEAFEPPAKADPTGEWLDKWRAEHQVQATTEPWRLSHLMWLIAIIAVLLTLVIAMGAPIVAGGAVMLFAMALGAGLMLARRRNSQQDSLLWTLAIATERGMPLGSTVAAFAEQYRGRYRYRVLNLAAQLDWGASLPEALERVPRVVSRDALLMAHVGQRTNRLPEALRMAASSRASQLPIWTAIASRFAYVLALLLAIQSITGFLLYFITPKFEAIFKDFGLGLPTVTVAVINMSHALVKYGFLTVWAFPVELILLIFLPFSFLGWVNYDVPLFDRLLRRRHFALIARAISLSVDAGQPIESGLTTLASFYPTWWVRRKLIKVEEAVHRGVSWIDALLRQGLIQPSDAEVLTAATKVGNLGWVLRELSESSERRLAYRFQAVVQTLFPFVVVCIGVFIFLLLVAFFSPLVQLIGRLSG